jgi:hypothetical protein
VLDGFMKGAFIILLAVLGLTITGSAQSKGAAASTVRISEAEVSEDGVVQITFNNGRSLRVPAAEGQVGSEKLQLAANRLLVGWLNVDASVGSYSVPTTLTVYTVDKPLKLFGDGLMLRDWEFTDSDKHVQFSSSPAHGPQSEWLTTEVHDIETGRLLRRWLERADVSLATITGRVTDGSGAALTDTVVSIRDDPAAEAFSLTRSVERGQFTLPGIAPGQHELWFEHPRFKTRRIKITVNADADSADAGVVTLERRPPPNR